MIVTSAIAYGVTLLVFVALDMVWLTWVGGPLYRQVLSDILTPNVRLEPALLFYLIYPLGLMVFAVHPAINGGTVLTALLMGALFGFFTYVTYDLTNFATLKSWTLGVTLMDIAWGCFLGGAAAAAAASAGPSIASWVGSGV